MRVRVHTTLHSPSERQLDTQGDIGVTDPAHIDLHIDMIFNIAH
jgi:hypothetical protein